MAKPVQVHFEALPDSGYVQAKFLVGEEVLASTTLQYPRQGALIGGPENSERYAALMNTAARSLNKVLRELCS